MDQITLASYDAQAQALAATQRSKTPLALQRLITHWFVPGAATADIGCGSGRDTAWLAAQGFPTIGVEPSAGMRAEAQAAFPQLDVRPDGLPELAGIPTAAFTNVLCSAVLMHLPADQQPSAVAALARIMRPGGRLVLTYRASQVMDVREPDGRLYTPISATELVTWCQAVGLQLLLQAEDADGGRPGVVWSSVVAERVHP
ncbi:MAG: class I SAM-dependent methyltransferase [Oscillochloridaceae bacterium umkhey_bin13]